MLFRSVSTEHVKLYQSMVGSLMYAAIGTRPDIAHAVTILSRHCARPLEMHITAAKRVFRYLKKTQDHGITYKSDFFGTLSAYTDADWATCKKTRKSIGGFITFLNGPISWASKTQSVVALSTLESEFIAASDATREVLWLRRLLSSIGQLPNTKGLTGDVPRL